VLGKNIQNCAYEPLPEAVSPQLRELVTHMLQPQPASRPTIAQVRPPPPRRPAGSIQRHGCTHRMPVAGLQGAAGTGVGGDSDS
jgi:hypothetical protein